MEMVAGRGALAVEGCEEHDRRWTGRTLPRGRAKALRGGFPQDEAPSECDPGRDARRLSDVGGGSAGLGP